MNGDKLKNDLLTLQKSGAENTDIQSRLYSWFEEKGIVNKLRAHIREQMISALGDNAIWNTNKINVTSPKIQAINLLVADFLMNQENLFTLSVFITEVPLLGNLHEFSSYVNRLGSNTQKLPVTKPSFQLNDVQDILEALGIEPNSDISELACQYYFNEKQVNSLFACIFKSITTIKNNNSEYNEVNINENCKQTYKSTKIESNNYEHKLNSFLVSVEDILSSFNLNEGQKNTLKIFLKQYHQNNNAQELSVYKEHLKKLEKQNKEMVEKVADVEQMLSAHFHSHDSKLLFQKEEVEYARQQLRLEQQQLYQLINVFEEKEKSMQEKLKKSDEEYTKKLQDIENQKCNLKLKEMEILRHDQMLKRESLNCINETKINECNQVQLLQEQNIDLAKQLGEIKSKLDRLEGYKIVEETSCSNKIDYYLQRTESSLDREMVKKLQKDNDELREFIKVQRQRIEELSNKASGLAKQIEKTHQVPLTKTAYENRNVKKKLCFVDNKKNCYANQNISSTTTDYSTTVLESDNLTEDDILIKEAKSRLKTLEFNTAKVEQNLKNFQLNRSRQNTDLKFIRDNKTAYNKIRSNFSDDSDLDMLKQSSNKVNLKELANKIGYHRSIRRSMYHSQSENDTSPEIVRNIKFKNYTNVTNISPIKILSSSIRDNDVNNESPVNIQNSRTESPINKLKQIQTEVSMNKCNISAQSPKENQLQIESNVINMLPPDTNNYVQNNDSVDLKTFKHTDVTDSPQKPTSVQQVSSNGVHNLSTSLKLQESDHTISFGSNKSDKSSDFWA